MKDLKRQRFNPNRTGNTTYCDGCPFNHDMGALCSLGFEIRYTKIADKWPSVSYTCTLNDVVWSTTEERKTDVEQETG